MIIMICLTILLILLITHKSFENISNIWVTGKIEFREMCINTVFKVQMNKFYFRLGIII